MHQFVRTPNRRSKISSGISLRVLTGVLFGSVLAHTGSPAFAAAAQNPCELPFLNMINPHTGRTFTMADALNQNPSVGEQYNYRARFLVADLNTKDENGQCKGVEESYPLISPNAPDASAFPDLRNEANFRYFISNVQGDGNGHGFYSAPAKFSRVTNFKGTNYCTGQTISFCEIREGRPVEIMRLATSSQRSNTGSTLYDSLNLVTLRSWAKDRNYSALDAKHDVETGGVAAGQSSGLHLSHYTGGGGWVMPNFVKWDAAPGFETRGYMGMHQLTQGESPIVVPGSPVSHGCFRLSKYGAVLNRWWTPFGAKMFIRSDSSKYRQVP